MTPMILRNVMAVPWKFLSRLGPTRRVFGVALLVGLLCAAASRDLGAGEIPTIPVSRPEVVRLWPEGKMPGEVSSLPDEPDATVDRTRIDGVKNVRDPDVTLYRAQGTGPFPTVIVCPGGGYTHLAYKKEGTEIAAWLNSIGLNAMVLRYRVPKNQDAAFMDAQRAVRLARTNAKAWGIDPERLGVLGFSAGGHLCARLSTNFDQPAYPMVDDADRSSCRPDFVVLVYPAYLNVGETVSRGLPVSKATPPTLIIHNEDDPGFVRGSKLYADLLTKTGVPSEFRLYQQGGHGYGLRSRKDVSAWPRACESWLRSLGVLAQ